MYGVLEHLEEELDSDIVSRFYKYYIIDIINALSGQCGNCANLNIVNPNDYVELHCRAGHNPRDLEIKRDIIKKITLGLIKIYCSDQEPLESIDIDGNPARNTQMNQKPIASEDDFEQ